MKKNNPEQLSLFSNINEQILAKINQRERQILVHSYLYYVQSENLIDDFTYDKFARDLARLIKAYPDEHKQSVYYKYFKDFGQDNCYSGYHLPKDLPEIINVAFRLLRYREIDQYRRKNG